jgi:enoyl-CoA hydratase/carnithine racemase
MPRLPLIQKIFGGGSVEEILSGLEEERRSGSEREWAEGLLKTLAQMSPTSMKLTFRLLELGAGLELQEALQLEYRLSQRCCENHDFTEGT